MACFDFKRGWASCVSFRQRLLACLVQLTSITPYTVLFSIFKNEKNVIFADGSTLHQNFWNVDETRISDVVAKLAKDLVNNGGKQMGQKSYICKNIISFE